MQNKPLIDIILNVYGEELLLPMCLDSIPAGMGDIPYRITIVDNGSQSKIIDSIIKNAMNTLPIRRIILKHNIGYPAGMNKGARNASAPLLLFLTSDIFMKPNFGVNLTKGMDFPEAGIIGPKLIFPDNPAPPHSRPGTVQHAGIVFNIMKEPFHIYLGWSPDHPKVNTENELQAVTGATFITRRKLFEELGGFNEEYGKGTYEDMELCFRCRLELGKGVYYMPTAEAFHFAGGSIFHGPGKAGFSLKTNAHIFTSRFNEHIIWDEWRF